MTKIEFEQALLNTIRNVMKEYDTFKKTNLGCVSSVEASRAGNFRDPDSKQEYGFKFTIGNTDFWEDEKEETDEEDEE